MRARTQNFIIALLLVCFYGANSQVNTICKLQIVSHPEYPSLEGSSVGTHEFKIELFPAAYSSPIDNLNNHRFNILGPDEIPFGK